MLVSAAGTSLHAAWEPGHRGAAELMGTLVTASVTHRGGRGYRGGGKRHSAGEGAPPPGAPRPSLESPTCRGLLSLWAMASPSAKPSPVFPVCQGTCLTRE